MHGATRFGLVLCCVLGAAGALAGCPAPAPSGDASTDAAPPPTDQGTIDLGTPDAPADARPDATPDAPADAFDAAPDFDAAPLFSLRGGTIGIAQAAIEVAGMTFANVQHSAAFYDLTRDGGGDGGGVRCDQRQEGACILVNCVVPPGSLPSGADGGTAPGPGGLSAGPVTIHGGTGADIVLTPDSTGHYPPASLNMPRWRDGDRITINAPGGDVPAFSTMITFPPVVTVDEPAVAPFTTVTIDRSTGFAVRWTGTGPRQMLVDLTQVIRQSDGTTVAHVLHCGYPIDALRVMVTPSLLRDFEPPSDAGMTTATLLVESMATQQVTAGDFVITVEATPGGLVALANVR